MCQPRVSLFLSRVLTLWHFGLANGAFILEGAIVLAPSLGPIILVVATKVEQSHYTRPGLGIGLQCHFGIGAAVKPID